MENRRGPSRDPRVTPKTNILKISQKKQKANFAVLTNADFGRFFGDVADEI